MNTCIIFDLDGTLIDSREDLALAVNLMRRDFGLSALRVEDVTSFVGNGARKLVERSLSGTSVNIDEALPLMKKHYLEHLFDKTTLYEGVAGGLAELRSTGIPLAVISNKPTGPSRKILEHFGICGLFREVIGGDSGFALKPDPESILHVVKKFAASPENSWILGDNYTDLESGRRAGLKRCFAQYGFGKQRNENFDFAAENFDIFVRYIMNMRF